MSAAATAAGYLYAHGRLSAAEALPSRRLEPKNVRQGESQPAKEARTPRIEYRKRRFYPLPSAA